MNTLLKAGLITTFIFVTGIIFGLWIGTERVGELDRTIQELEASVKSAELQLMFFDVMEEEISCEYLLKRRWAISEEAEKLGKEVERFEASMKLDEESFYDLKERYTLSLLRSWLGVERIKNACDADFVTVVYFYSNLYCGKCEEQGIILSYYKEKLGNDLLVYSIDSDLNLEIVEMLKDVYGVNQYPFLVINNQRYEGFRDAAELRNLFCEENIQLNIC